MKLPMRLATDGSAATRMTSASGMPTTVVTSATAEAMLMMATTTATVMPTQKLSMELPRLTSEPRICVARSFSPFRPLTWVGIVSR